jgi:hypothetical protein
MQPIRPGPRWELKLGSCSHALLCRIRVKAEQPPPTAQRCLRNEQETVRLAQGLRLTHPASMGSSVMSHPSCRVLGVRQHSCAEDRCHPQAHLLSHPRCPWEGGRGNGALPQEDTVSREHQERPQTFVSAQCYLIVHSMNCEFISVIKKS